jgi:hypothetical protein
VKNIAAFGTSLAVFMAVSFAPSALLLVALLLVGAGCFLAWYVTLSPAQWHAIERLIRAWRQR